MLKQLLVAAAAITGGLLPVSGGVADAETGFPIGGDQEFHGQNGLVNLTNTEVLHNVNAVIGVCNNNINVVGVQVPVEDVLNGVEVPVASPGDHSNVGATPETCATGAISNGGTVQDG